MMFVLNDQMWEVLQRTGTTVLFSVMPPPPNREWVVVTHQNLTQISEKILFSIHQIVMDTDRLIYNSPIRKRVFVADEELLREIRQ